MRQYLMPLLGFAVVLLLLLVPYPRAPIQVAMQGTDLKFLTGPAARDSEGSLSTDFLLDAPGHDALNFARIQGPFVLSFRARVLYESGPTIPVRLALLDENQDSFAIWFERETARIWVGARTGSGRWQFRQVLGKYEVHREYEFRLERLSDRRGFRLIVPSFHVDQTFSNLAASEGRVLAVQFVATSSGGISRSRVDRVSLAWPSLTSDAGFEVLRVPVSKHTETLNDGWWIHGDVGGFRFDLKHQVASTVVFTSPTTYSVSFRVRVLAESGSVMPVQVNLWDPTSLDTFAVVFSGGGQDVQVGAREGEHKWLFMKSVGKYELGQVYDITLAQSLGPEGSISLTIPQLRFKEIHTGLPVAKHGMLNLSIGATATQGRILSEITDIVAIMPDQTYFTYLTRPSFLSKAVRPGIGVILALLLFIGFRRLLADGKATLVSKLPRLNPGPFLRHRRLLLLLAVALPLQILLSTVGEHPYDMFTMKAWAYVTHQYGFHALYPLTTLTPSGQSIGLGDISYFNLQFPYPPLSGYVFYLTGAIFGRISPEFDFGSFLLSFLIKIVWILCLDLGAVLIYAYVRKLMITTNRSQEAQFAPWIVASAYALNPGLNLNAAVWGQFETLTMLLYALSMVSALSRRPMLAWVGLLLALTSKQAPIVQAPLVVGLILYVNGLRVGLLSLGRALLLMVFILLPWIWSGYTPRFLFNITVGQNVMNVLSSNPIGVADWQKTVATGTYNIWPLVTQIINGKEGFSRYTVPSSTQLGSIGLNYSQIGALLAFTFLGVLTLVAYTRRRRVLTDGTVFLVAAILVLSIYTFVTSVHERFLGYIFMPLALSYPIWSSTRIFWIFYALLMLVYTASIHGTLVLTAHWFPETSPGLLPSAHWLNRIALPNLSNDYVITGFSILVIVLFILLFSKLFHLVRQAAAD